MRSPRNYKFPRTKSWTILHDSSQSLALGKGWKLFCTRIVTPRCTSGSPLRLPIELRNQARAAPDEAEGPLTLATCSACAMHYDGLDIRLTAQSLMVSDIQRRLGMPRQQMAAPLATRRLLLVSEESAGLLLLLNPEQLTLYTAAGARGCSHSL